jgi:hypothetical protein
MESTYEELSKQIELEWNDEQAEYIYVLTHTYKLRGVCEVATYGFFKTKTTVEYGEWSESTDPIAWGDRMWAEQIAQHYGLSLPKEPMSSK